jgi:hypothetical protein
MNSSQWRTSSYTNGDTNCVEVANTLDTVRDSKYRTGPTLRADVANLVRAVKAGHLDRR